MDISLNGYENFIKEQMATGLYNSVNDIVQEAMSLLKLRKSISQHSLFSLHYTKLKKFIH